MRGQLRIDWRRSRFARRAIGLSNLGSLERLTGGLRDRGTRTLGWSGLHDSPFDKNKSSATLMKMRVMPTCRTWAGLGWT